MKAEKSSPLNALDLANARLGEARAAAEAHVAQIRAARARMDRIGFQFASTDSVAQVAADGAEWERKRTAARSAEMNFNEAVFVRDLLEASPESKASLEAAYTFLETRHAAYLKASKQTLLSKAAAMFKPSPIARDEQPQRREPPRGPWGVIELPPVETELEVIRQLVESFPNSKSFAGIISLMNALNGRLQLPEERPVQAKRMDKGFLVIERRPGTPQPSTHYTHPLPIASTDQPEPIRRPMQSLVGF